MAYVKTDWKNREVERPRTFTLVENPDGTVTLIPAEGEVYEQGTPIVATVMNNMEDGIEEAHDDISDLDTLLDTVKTTANNALPKAGGTMTGNINFNNKLAEKPEIKNYSETLVKATEVTGTKALDLSQGNVFDMTLSGNTTFTFTNPAASGKVCSFTLILRQPSTLRTVTWPSSVKWNEDEIPEFVKSKTAIITFVTVNGGTRWYGMIAGTEYTT